MPTRGLQVWMPRVQRIQNSHQNVMYDIANPVSILSDFFGRSIFLNLANRFFQLTNDAET